MSTFRKLGPHRGETYESVLESYEIGPACDSPIEIRFGSRLSQSLRQIAPLFRSQYVIVMPGKPTVFAESHLMLRPQYRTEHSRFDFAVQFSTCDRPMLLVECDGREFHSSAKQRDNDRRKDLEAREMGAKIFRFTGSEIYQCVDWCVSRVLIPILEMDRAA